MEKGLAQFGNVKKKEKRKYNEAYLSFGFTFIAERDGTQKPQCFLCGKVLANGSMKPTKLKEHLTCVHPENASDSVDLFCAKKARFEKARTLPKLGFAPTQKPCPEASYKVAYRIAKQKKSNTIEETLVKPCALEMVELAIDTLEMVNSFFAKQNFDWKKNLGTLCTDGAPAMLSNTSGFAALVKKEAPQVIVTHCFLHRHALASKTLPAILKEVLSTGVKVVNFIRARAVNHRVFKRFCQ
ncbi:protein ZBED8-like [Homarus americanus]|uniref:protein ZBED8-like n=1 Tax=Homarus americanus TaxID=6706 RepID=UPI001C482FF4|nr:protein ZBED8-like [Homarus americanus]